jgi:alkanesulfonate monooxygenase SsuD/methylene tetrahydromethanopterin reductase-like flavin-dependent oxidoreductase (luciferase family)
MRFGIHVGDMAGPLEELRKLWKFADTRGFDWFSVADHFQESPPRGGDLNAFEAITTLTAAAMETTRVRLGSAVYCVVYRNPGLLAKSLTTIDHLSHGRVDCGLGAGWHEVEAKAFGYPFPSIGPREDMLEEYAQALRLLFDPEGRRANFEGKHFRLSNAPNNPKPLQPRIPIWIGGRGEKRTIRAAAKYADGWNGAYIGPADWKQKGQVLDQWCEKEGRDPKTIMRSVNLGFYLGADAKGAAPKRSSRATSAAAPPAPSARDTCAGWSRTRTPWSTSSARSAARGSASRFARGRTIGTRSRPSPPRSCARPERPNREGSCSIQATRRQISPGATTPARP